MRWILWIAACLAMSPAKAQSISVEDVCGERPIVSTKERQGSLDASIEGTARTLFGARGSAEVDVVYRDSVNDIFSSYPDAERANVTRAVLYQYCALIYTADDLSSREKLEEFRKMEVIRELQSGSFDRKSAEFIDTQILEQIEIRLAGCNYRSSLLQCSLTIRPEQQDQRLSVSMSFSNASDDAGNLFKMQGARIANGTHEHVLIKHVETPLVVGFFTQNISPKLLSRIIISFIKGPRSFRVVFRNVPVGTLSR